jgi:hypothetical protein
MNKIVKQKKPLVLLKQTNIPTNLLTMEKAASIMLEKLSDDVLFEHPPISVY